VAAGGGGWRFGVAATLLGILLGAGAMLLFNGYFVRSYLLANPEVIPEAMQRLQDTRMADAVGRHRAALERPYHSAWAGAADGDVVLVEFFDYACGFCRASNPDVERLLREDPRLKVVWREYPVLGPDSEEAAVASMAAAQSGRFRQFHDRMFAEGPPSAATIARARTALGLGETAMNAAHRAELQNNATLARAVGASGTPTFVVGDQVLDGAVGYKALKDAIAEARASP
jgi:protein-disulfide isomerase